MKKKETERVNVTLTNKQISAIDSLIGTIGNSRTNVASSIIMMWLYNEKHIEVK